MISKVIYFLDGWVRANVNARTCMLNAESLARQCIDDAARAGFTNEQLEQDLGTDLVDFLTSVLQAHRPANGQVAIQADLSP